MAAAIRPWQRPAALAGAQLPALSRGFAVAVVNAADNARMALAGDATAESSRRQRAGSLPGRDWRWRSSLA